MELFGFDINRVKRPEDEKTVKSFTSPEFDDGAIVTTTGGAYGTYVDLEGSVKGDVDAINKYRELSLQPEVEVAIDDVINEVINPEDDGTVVRLSLDKLAVDERVKTLIQNEFKTLLRKLSFNEKSYEIFRKWYVDGRMYYHAIIDEKRPENGIMELRYIDPRKIKKIVETEDVKDKNTNAIERKVKNEYFVYNNEGFASAPVNTFRPMAGATVRIATDSVLYSDSGIMSKDNRMVLSHLHKAIKPANQLKALEDAAVIFRLVRAPERRIFYVDVGNLPPAKAEQYMKQMMTAHKNKLQYDSGTGEIRDDRKFMNALEDYWIPRREGGKSTDIQTLPGGQNMGQMDDIYYFQKKLYRALNVPTSRMEAEVSYTLGRASEINRDEVKFHKFVRRLRSKFNELLYDMLRTQLVLKKVVNTDEFEMIKGDLILRYNESNYFTEMKNNELMRERLLTLREAEMYNGKYFSTNYLRKNVLMQSDAEKQKIDAENLEELQQMSAMREEA